MPFGYQDTQKCISNLDKSAQSLYLSSHCRPELEQLFGQVDLSEFTQLTKLVISFNQITSLKLPSQLVELNCSDNKLTNLDLFNCSQLTNLCCRNNELKFLNLNYLQLISLSCCNNQLTALDLSKCSRLTFLCCYNNQLTILDLSNCSLLTSLDCFGNKLTNLILPLNNQLERLSCAENPNLNPDFLLYLNPRQLT